MTTLARGMTTGPLSWSPSYSLVYVEAKRRAGTTTKILW